jgi:hypothetical protein
VTETIVSGVGKPNKVWKLVFSPDEFHADPVRRPALRQAQRTDAEKARGSPLLKRLLKRIDM